MDWPWYLLVYVTSDTDPWSAPARWRFSPSRLRATPFEISASEIGVLAKRRRAGALQSETLLILLA